MKVLVKQRKLVCTNHGELLKDVKYSSMALLIQKAVLQDLLGEELLNDEQFERCIEMLNRDKGKKK